MSVEQFGATLLGDVQEEGLDLLFAQLRQTFHPKSAYHFGVPQLDRLLAIFQTPQHPITPRRPGWTSPEEQNPNREQIEAQAHDLNESAHEQSTPRRFPTIEITSSIPTTGKTTFLYYLTGLATLPQSFGGTHSAVLWLDTDNRFSAVRLSAIIHGHLRKSHPSLTAAECSEIVQQSLHHVHVLKPRSSTDLLSFLDSLPAYLLDKTKHVSVQRILGLLVLDSATAFHWQDRMGAEMAGLEASTTTNVPTAPSTSNHPSKTAQIINVLRHLQTRFECAVLFTTDPCTRAQPRRKTHHQQQPQSAQEQSGQSLSSRTAIAAQPQLQPEEPIPRTPWTSFATLTLTISRISVPQFGPTMTMEACLRDQERRQEVVRRMRLVVAVDWDLSAGDGSGSSGVRLRDVVGALERGGGFVLALETGVTGGGVDGVVVE